LIADAITSRLGDYPWPGNPREITKLIHQVFRLGESHLDKLVGEMRDTFQEARVTFALEERSLPTERLAIRLEAFEKRQYAEAASQAHTVGEVASSLGVTRQTAARALRRYNLRLGKFVKEAR
jgi:transcriptional regulator with PAS, ATPase and Fis domain